MKNAPILLLNEATSALDAKSEAAVRSALKNLMRGRTVIAIAHRISTLDSFDRLNTLGTASVSGAILMRVLQGSWRRYALSRQTQRLV